MQRRGCPLRPPALPRRGGSASFLPSNHPARAGGQRGLASLLLSASTALVLLGPATLLRSPWDPVSPREKDWSRGGGCGRAAGEGGAGDIPTLSVSLPPPSIFPSPDQPANVPLIPSALNTGGSLPDLTNLHFPSPLPTPLDPDETTYPSLSGGNSTSNLANTMTHLGISGSLGLGTGYDSPGEGWPGPPERGDAGANISGWPEQLLCRGEPRERPRQPGATRSECSEKGTPWPGIPEHSSASPGAPSPGAGWGSAAGVRWHREVPVVSRHSARAKLEHPVLLPLALFPGRVCVSVCVSVSVSIVLVASVTFHPTRGRRGAPAWPGPGSRAWGVGRFRG